MLVPVKTTGKDGSSEFFISNFDGSLKIKSSLSECALFVKGDIKAVRNVQSRMRLHKSKIEQLVGGRREVKIEEIRFGSLRFL
jgi:hypothetical protein